MIQVVDGSFLSHRIMYMGMSIGSTSAGFQTTRFLMSLAKNIKKYKPEMVIVLWDIGGNNEARENLGTYKDGRPTEEENPVMTEMFKSREYLKQILPKIGVASTELYGVEADDFAYLAANMYNHVGGIFISDDYDWKQCLISDKWSLLRDKADKFITFADFAKSMEEENEPHIKFAWYKALTGDGSDNIAGIKGCGHVTAVKFSEYLARMEPVPTGSAIGKRIAENIEKVKANHAAIDMNWVLDREDAVKALRDSVDALPESWGHKEFSSAIACLAHHADYSSWRSWADYSANYKKVHA